MESVSGTGSSADASVRDGVARHRADDGGVRWTILPGWRDDILGAHAPKWSDLEHEDRATIIKSNANRTVWRIELATRSIFVKRARIRTIVGWVRKLLGFSAGRREWRSAHLARTRNVPTVKYVAFGRTARDEFVVSEAFCRARPLNEAWSATINVADVAECKRHADALILGAAQLLARAHRGGFFHGDDHPGNVLVSAVSDGSCDTVYLDMQRSRARRRAGDRAVVHSIAQLHQWFQTRASTSQRWRFLRAYCSQRRGGDEHQGVAMARQLLPRILDESAAQRLALWAKRDRRILSGTNRYFASLPLGDGARAIVTLRFRRRDLVPPPGVPDRSVDQWRALLAGARLDGNGPQGSSPGPICSSSRFGERLSWWFTGSPARRRFVTGHRLRHRDLPCRCPVALIESGAFLGNDAACVWQADCPATASLAEACDRLHGPGRSHREVLRSLARTLMKMSRRGAHIATMSDDTFGVVTGSGNVIINDPRCVRLTHPDPHRHLVMTLQALYAFAAGRGVFRRTDGVRLLQALSPGDWKPMWRSLADVNKPSSRRNGKLK